MKALLPCLHEAGLLPVRCTLTGGRHSSPCKNQNHPMIVYHHLLYQPDISCTNNSLGAPA